MTNNIDTPVNTFQEYELCHKILGKLRELCLVKSQKGSDKEGHIPLDVLIIKNSNVTYGTFVALLNGNTVEKGDTVISYTGIPTTREKVNITNDDFQWKKVNVALQILNFNNHIKDYSSEDIFNDSDRSIELTKNGLLAYNTKFYLKENRNEMFGIVIHKSQTKANTRMSTFTIVIAISAALTFIATGLDIWHRLYQSKELKSQVDTIKTQSNLYNIQIENLNHAVKKLEDQSSKYRIKK